MGYVGHVPWKVRSISATASLKKKKKVDFRYAKILLAIGGGFVISGFFYILRIYIHRAPLIFCLLDYLFNITFGKDTSPCIWNAITNPELNWWLNKSKRHFNNWFPTPMPANSKFTISYWNKQSIIEANDPEICREGIFFPTVLIQPFSSFC